MLLFVITTNLNLVFINHNIYMLFHKLLFKLCYLLIFFFKVLINKTCAQISLPSGRGPRGGVYRTELKGKWFPETKKNATNRAAAIHLFLSIFPLGARKTSHEFS